MQCRAECIIDLEVSGEKVGWEDCQKERAGATESYYKREKLKQKTKKTYTKYWSGHGSAGADKLYIWG